MNVRVKFHGQAKNVNGAVRALPDCQKASQSFTAGAVKENETCFLRHRVGENTVQTAGASPSAFGGR